MKKFAAHSVPAPSLQATWYLELQNEQNPTHFNKDLRKDLKAPGGPRRSWVGIVER